MYIIGQSQYANGKFMHIAVFDANIDASPFAARHPSEVDKFRALLGPRAAGWRFSDFAVHKGVFPQALTGIEGIMISGSPASVNDRAEWVETLMQTIRAAVAADIPVFGACFGHQAIARALGGTVGRNPDKGWRLGRVESAVAAPAPWMQGPQGIGLHAAHKEQVTALPPGVRVLGGTADVPFGHLALGKRVYSTQYHPELDTEFMADLLGVMQADLPAEVHAGAVTSLARPADNGIKADWIARFFEQARV